jgi:hypothetical protein
VVHVALAGTAAYCTARGWLEAESSSADSERARWQQCSAIAEHPKLSKLWVMRERVGNEQLKIEYDFEVMNCNTDHCVHLYNML